MDLLVKIVALGSLLVFFGGLYWLAWCAREY